MTDNENSDGFNFIITLLVAFGTIIYGAYSYFQTRAIDNNLYVISIGVISVLIITSLFLIAYIIVKGYSMEAKDPEKINLEKIASNIHLLAFWAGTTTLLFVGVTFYLFITQPNRDIAILIIYIFYLETFILALVYLSLVRTYLFTWDEIPGNSDRRLIEFLSQNFRIDWVKKAHIEKLYNDTVIKVSTEYNFLSLSLNSQITKAYLKIDDGTTDEFIIRKRHGKLNIYKRQLYSKETLIFIIMLIVFVIAWAVTYTSMLNYMNGQVTIDLAGNNYKKSPIIVSIGVTGRNSESTIYLNNISENKLNQIDKITLGPGHKDENISGINKVLVGNAYDFGKYYLFIDTNNPNMTVGYYELVYSRPIDGYKYGKSFYLTNASEKQ